MKVRLKEFWQNFLSVLSRPEMAILPGQLAFFFVLSIVPTITMISYGASFLNLPIDFPFSYLSTLNSNKELYLISAVSSS